jgi:two-component system chemotaxis response regulator CheY
MAEAMCAELGDTAGYHDLRNLRAVAEMEWRHTLPLFNGHQKDLNAPPAGSFARKPEGIGQNMKELVDWLRKVEQFAHELYSRASDFFAEDERLSEFLRRLALDEASHYHIMGSASEFISKGNLSVTSSIELDPVTISHLEEPLKEAYNSLVQGTLSQRRMIESIVKAENSEWNILFLYAINSLKPVNKLFQYGASVIQSHQDRIEQFLSAHPEGRLYVDGIRQLPTVWKPCFLVVDDEEPLRSLLHDLLATRGVVETSPHGRDALEKTRRRFFDVIVSDINMPIMSGLDFYREAIKEDPTTRSRFVFCSGEVSSDQRLLFQQNSAPHLTKPFKVRDLMEAVDHILRESAEATEVAEQSLGTRGEVRGNSPV